MVRGSVDKNIDLDEVHWKGSGVLAEVTDGDKDDGEMEAQSETELWDPDASVIPSFSAFS